MTNYTTAVEHLFVCVSRCSKLTVNRLNREVKQQSKLPKKLPVGGTHENIKSVFELHV